MGNLKANHARWLRTAVLAGAAVLAVVPGRFAAGPGSGSASSHWSPAVSATNTVVSSPTSGGGYPQFTPVPGGCVGPGPNNFHANPPDSPLAVLARRQPNVAPSEFFFDQVSTPSHLSLLC